MINNALSRLGVETAGKYVRKLDRRLLPVVVVACSLMAYDLFSRLLVVQEDFLVKTERQQVNLTPRPSLDNETFNVYLDRLSALTKQSPSSEAAQMLPAAGESTDRSGYSQLGEFSYRLVAVLKSAETVALLSKLSDGSDVAELIEARMESIIGGYQITSIDPRAIVLSSKAGDKVELKLFERAALDDK